MRGADERATGRARGLRRRATEAEQRIWGRLRDRRLGGFKFVRQMAIGAFVVDFCCRESWLIVEIDGSQHAKPGKDLARDAWLRGEGYRVLRFWNNEVLARTDAVLEAILAALGDGARDG